MQAQIFYFTTCLMAEEIEMRIVCNDTTDHID